MIIIINLTEIMREKGKKIISKIIFIKENIIRIYIIKKINFSFLYICNMVGCSKKDKKSFNTLLNMIIYIFVVYKFFNFVIMIVQKV